MSEALLVLNSGSSTLKYALYDPETLKCLTKEIYEFQTSPPDPAEYDDALSTILNSTPYIIIAAGHRVVHGGREFSEPVMITDDILERLHALTPLAPLHQPFNLMAIERLRGTHPKLPQVACFDTAFHRTQPELSQLYALPKNFSQDGILRYGFHGLSYEYIASQLSKHADSPNGRTIIAHLGNGASLCAVKNLKSVSSTMGFTALEGLMMGTRCGRLDPGIILYLMQKKQMSIEEINDLLYKRSGLLGVSGISGDMRDLMAFDHKDAKTAIDLFCLYIVRAIGELATELEGLDTLVFTAGIGEHNSFIRAKVCAKLAWLGVELEEKANNQNALCISTTKSPVQVLVLSTNEELVIASHTKNLL